jgi:O-antigen ligase
VPRPAACALYLTYGSVVSILFSIALSQFLLGAALLILLIARSPLRFPPIKLPLALLFGWTLLSAIHSGHFIQGLPQLRKFFVFATAVVVCSAFRTGEHVLKLAWLWAGVSMISAVVAFIQLWTRYQQAHAEGATYYDYFLDARLHGLASHWMTFGGELMIVTLLLLSASLWAKRARTRLIALLCFPVLWACIALGLTRGVFLVGLPLGAAYLLFSWRPWTIVAIPGALLLTSLLMPFQFRERIISVIYPHGTDDSNSRRVILIRTGLQMIRAHPILGVGPEQVGRQFDAYVPADVPRPLPKGWYGHLHNVYLQFAAERGLPALGFLLWILARVIVDLSREARLGSGSSEEWIFRGAVAITLGIVGEGLFEHNLGDSEVLTMFLAAISCGYVTLWHMKEQPRPQPVPLSRAHVPIVRSAS